MTGNCVDDHLGDGVVFENTYGSVVSGNMLEDGDGRAIVLGRDCYGITVSGNSFCNSFVGANVVIRKPDDLLAAGIVLEGTRDVNIVGNTFSSVPKAVELREPASENVSFSHNKLIDAPSGIEP